MIDMQLKIIFINKRKYTRTAMSSGLYIPLKRSYRHYAEAHLI